ncbi:mannose-6-phosphate isomerase, class I [Leucobacter triazinivorans]|uniref:mannose-6-phosphate isomerase n=1 Tax=Leucobacter triazinivorans TaxID=1784719 RepID=A0A4P6KG16_9MICO|nr:mannose-6-phosphate isomerase, class I [Leucobacter triazinivorans]QBE49435.1 mannose-6-phosphate isomerase, class I [Leucobacter triazinivorans]
MLIFIENTPRAYAWGSRDALPDMLGTAPNGEPQAELWLGTHPGSPAHVAKATPQAHTLIDLVESDPERYGVDGGPLPFLLKVLAIGAPLSLQVHPDSGQAEAGFAAEEAAGIPRDARHRNYGDRRHKPELLVALGDVTALSGFRALPAVRRDLALLAAAVRHCDDRVDSGAGGEAGERAERAEYGGADALDRVADRLAGDDGERRRELLQWAFSGDPVVGRALRALQRVIAEGDAEAAGLDPERAAALRELVAAHPGDPGVLVSLLLHLVHLAPGEAIFLRARQLHAYLSGIAVEVMASSDNVLRAGLTEKHVDVAELCRIVDTDELDDPRFPCTRSARGLVAWCPDVPDFRLLRARLCDPDDDSLARVDDGAPLVEVPAEHPLVLVVTAGRVRVERAAADAEALAEVATARRGQSLYVSAGEPVRLTGHGEVFLATVGG